MDRGGGEGTGTVECVTVGSVGSKGVRSWENFEWGLQGRVERQ